MNTLSDVQNFVLLAKSAMIDDISNVIKNSDIGSNSHIKCENNMAKSMMELKSMSISFNPEINSCMSTKTAEKIVKQVSNSYINNKSNVSQRLAVQPSSAAAATVITYLVEDNFALIVDDDGTKIIID